nr:hypothetical protein [Frankia sp. AgB32]
MNAVPAATRGGASGMRATFMNSVQVLSIGLFFSLMIAGLASTLPASLHDGLNARGVPVGVTDRVANLPPVGSLFAAFLDYNPMQNLLGDDTLSRLPAADAQEIIGEEFFPHLISSPFHHGLIIVFSLAIGMSLVAALASLLRGGRYVHIEAERFEAGRFEAGRFEAGRFEAGRVEEVSAAAPTSLTDPAEALPLNDADPISAPAPREEAGAATGLGGERPSGRGR